MIGLQLTGDAFEQDIRPLLKSFFPKEELVISYEETPEGDWRLFVRNHKFFF